MPQSLRFGHRTRGEVAKLSLAINTIKGAGSAVDLVGEGVKGWGSAADFVL